LKGIKDDEFELLMKFLQIRFAQLVYNVK